MSTKTDAYRLQRQDWEKSVKDTINEFLDKYGNNSDCYSKNSYAVFDFDNTTSIFDSEDVLSYYQMLWMAYEIIPADFKSAILADVPDPECDISKHGYCKGTFDDLAEDIAAAYSFLWEKYNGFSSKGLSDAQAEEIADDPYWREFAAKMVVFFHIVYSEIDPVTADKWMYWRFYGMTSEQLYDLAIRGISEISKKETLLIDFESPTELVSLTGAVKCSWVMGFSVTENQKELFKALSENGIDVWICSASPTDLVRAAVDCCGLNRYLKGVVGMTPNKDADGRYTAGYDFENGHGSYCMGDGNWTDINLKLNAITCGDGKVTAIDNGIAPLYDGHGPIFGCMDASGDFNFATEYKSMVLVLCINRGNRRVTDGGSLIGEVAIYQSDVLQYSLEKAEKNNDTYYILQGRDENGLRSFISDRRTRLYGTEGLKLIRSEKNQRLLDSFSEKGMSVKEIFESYSVFSKAEDNEFGFDYGFLDSYIGYRVR